MKRDLYWDSLKFILIYLVILGHCINIYLPSGGLNQALSNFIYTFHMPLFIFISGMFSHVKDREKYIQGILRILETYIVFQLLRTIITILMHNNVQISMASVLLSPRSTLWYLLSLIYWRVMVYYIPKKFLRENVVGIIFVCILISLFGGFVPIGHTLSLQRTMSFLPFFFMGYYAKSIDVKKYIVKIPVLLVCGVSLSIFLLYFLMFNKNIDYVLCGKSSYWTHTEFSPLMLCFARGIFLISATIMGAMMMRIVPTWSSFSRLGGNTLFIYIYHSFAIMALSGAIKLGYLPQNECLLIASSIIITLILILLSNIKFLTFLLNPVSNYMRNKHNSLPKQ